MLLHFVIALALVLGWPEAREYLKQATPIEVRLLAPEKPPEQVRPLPPLRPKKVSPPPRLAQPFAPPLPVPSPPPAMATTAPTASPIVAPPISANPSPVVIPEPARPAPPAPRTKLEPEPLIEAHFDADYLSNPKPSYPMASRRLSEAGVVHLRVQVGAAGQVLKLELKSSSGYPRLDQSALETVARWHFVPARRGATPVASWVVVPIIFSLL